MNYADLLKKYIKDSNLSLSDISEKLKPYGFNMDKAYLSRLQNNKARPASEELNKAIAEITGGDSEALIIAAYYEKAPEEVKKKLNKVASSDLIMKVLFNPDDPTKEGLEREILRLAHLPEKEASKELSKRYEALLVNDPIELLEAFKSTNAFKQSKSDDEYMLKLKAIREQKELSLKEAAYLCGVTEVNYIYLEVFGGLNGFEAFNSEYSKAIENLSNYKNGSVVEPLKPYTPDAMLRLPLLGSIRAGQTIDNMESNEAYTLVDPELLHGRDGFALRVEEDSMSADRIQDGDIVIVSKQEEIGPNDIAVVAIDDNKAVLRRVKPHGDMVMLVPSNSLFEPQLVPAKSISIIGKVVEVKIRMK